MDLWFIVLTYVVTFMKFLTPLQILPENVYLRFMEDP